MSNLLFALLLITLCVLVVTCPPWALLSRQSCSLPILSLRTPLLFLPAPHPHPFPLPRTWPRKMKRFLPSLIACMTVAICVATTLSTSTSMRLNSSRHAQAPV